jgi:D-3-phosphoglycerate dehydrogenase
MMKIFLTHSPQALENYYGMSALTALQALGEVTLNLQAQPLTLDDLLAQAKGHDVIVSSRDTAAPAAVFEQLPSLLAYCRVAVDIRNIDVAAASRHGVLITRATPGFDTSVAEWIVGVMIDLSRGISRASAAYWAGRTPAIQMGRELRGATLGIVGYGFIGRKIAALAQALGMQVLVNDPHAVVTEGDGGAQPIRSVSFDTVLTQADFVVCLAPAIPETADLFGRAAFARMRPSAYFINASRGELVDEAALHAALDDGLIAGAAMDVGRAADQMPSPALSAHPKMIATPHVGGLTPPASEHQAMDTVRQVKALLAGVMPEGAVNADHAARFARQGRHAAEAGSDGLAPLNESSESSEVTAGSAQNNTTGETL